MSLQKYAKVQAKKFQLYVEKFQNEKDVWAWASASPHIDLAFIQKWKHKPWSWEGLSKNKVISYSDKISSVEELPWSLIEIIDSYEEFLKFYDKLLPDMLSFSQHFSRNNKNIVQDVETYKSFPWQWAYISCNEHINEAFVLQYLPFLNKEWLAGNKALSPKFICSKLRCKRSWLAINPNINDRNIQFFFSERDFFDEECRNNLTSNPSVSLNFILEHPTYFWNIELVSYREDITKEHILKYPLYPWIWECISGCATIEKEFILNLAVSNPLIDLDTMKFYHSGLSVDEVWDVPPNKLACNLLLGSKKDKCDFLRTFYAVRTIEKAFLRAYWHPDYFLCRKRLCKEYDEMFFHGK